MSTLTVALFDQMTADPAATGHGYLGERSIGREYIPTDRIRRADEFIIERATAKGWDAPRLARWANSKDGRHFGERVLVDGTDPAAIADWYGLDL